MFRILERTYKMLLLGSSANHPISECDFNIIIEYRAFATPGEFGFKNI